ncbi:molybdopterin-guanine dinucleotide biosynthesis protein B [Halonotius roseus]|uniref:Molybdopterin-guanine dinucleotide biosynthesis protein B n=1 Tax=Halonotius roseus TaxID=2511997 RepID=A0A544QLZ6_9EURY|nr:molybdopterin-guanine dinucleotide biosynthesis protein B [Halonotius roseus]TQQ79619.1 molybdopterin-guanine dinucleotide biosynthesis protein B [Halonotius roseus]
MHPPLCIVGPSDAGKTTLIESLVAELADSGRVGTIKSIHHDIEIDTPGKDTHRHRTAGADTVVGLTPSLRFEITPGGKDAADSEVALLKSTVDDLRAAGYDYVLIEGYHNAPYPKLVVGDRPAAPPIIARGPPAAFDVSSLATAMIEGTLVDADSA